MRNGLMAVSVVATATAATGLAETAAVVEVLVLVAAAFSCVPLPLASFVELLRRSAPRPVAPAAFLFHCCTNAE